MFDLIPICAQRETEIKIVMIEVAIVVKNKNDCCNHDNDGSSRGFKK